MNPDDEHHSLNMNMTVYFHKLGMPQGDDQVIYARPDHPDWNLGATVTDDGEHLVITISVGTDDRFQIVHKGLIDPDAQPLTLIEGFDYDYTLIGNVSNVLYFRTNNAAPRGKLGGWSVD